MVASGANDGRQRRRFSAAEKVRIVSEADVCTGHGEIGELLRREGIYSSHLARWRAAREKHGVDGLASQAPGRKPSKDAKDRVIAQQEQRIAKLERENRIQQGLIELQRKAHEILGVALPRIEDSTEGDSSSSSDSDRRRSR